MQNLPFGVWLREYRRSHDLTRDDLAQLVGCSTETIRKLESGERRASKQIAQLLAERLNIPAGEQLAFIEFARTQPASPLLYSHAQTTGEPKSQSTAQSGAGPATTPPNNLRAPLTPLVGRERDLEDARLYLSSDATRLLTLVGPPGVGKTRLCLQAAHDTLPQFEDGVFFVPLAQVTDPSLVSEAIFRALSEGGAPEDDGDNTRLTRLGRSLHDKTMLLLLDNFEQLLGKEEGQEQAAAGILELLETCPRLKVLVTSREPLHVRGEQQLLVQPLDLPDVKGPLTASVVARSSAVALFVERARGIKPDFRLDDANAPAVAALCAQLDGLPLAIELVATRVKMLSPQAMLDRITGKRGDALKGKERLDLLAGGPHDLPGRHRTLHEAISWSYNLLNEEERRLFARLSVFSGGCTLVAIEAVCNPRGDLGASAFDAVASLLDKSLLRVEQPLPGEDAHDEARFSMLETIREHAAERLVERDEAESAHHLQVEYYLAMAQAADLQLTGADQQAWLGRLELDHDNMRSALSWAFSQGDIEIAAQLAIALRRFWEVRSHFSEGRRWLEQIVARSDRLSLPLRAKVLNGAGGVAMAQGDTARARDLLKMSLEMQRELGDDLGLATALNNLGMLLLSSGSTEESVPMFEEGITLLRKLGDNGRAATVLGNLGVALSEKRDYGRAVPILEESLALRRKVGNKRGVAFALGNLAEVSRANRDYARARELDIEALTLLMELNDKVGIAKIVVGLAALDAASERWEHAAKLLGIVEKLLLLLEAPMSVIAETEYNNLRQETQTAIGEGGMSAARASVERMELDEAISFALGHA